MSRSLSRLQAGLLGLVVLAILGAGVWGMYRIGEKQGLFQKTFAISVDVSDAQGVEVGAAVKIRGLPAGKVAAVSLFDDGTSESRVRMTLEIDEQFKDKIFADSVAQIESKGLLGTSVVSIVPGSTFSGPLEGNQIRSIRKPDLAEVTAKLYAVADRTEEMLKEIQDSNGTLVKLLKDDDLYHDLKAIAKDARGVLQNTNDSIDSVKSEVGTVKDFVRVGKEAIVSIKQNADAIKGLSIIRNYVEDAATILMRPNCASERAVCADFDLFEANTAVLHSKGKEHLQKIADWLLANKHKNSEVVVACFADPKNNDLTHAGAKKLTEKQAEVIREFLRERDVHKLGFWTRRTVTPLGMGKENSPLVEKEALPPANIQIVLYVPKV